ncbi:DHCW motif cupin fold protein [Dyadobacter sp. NIV53]|uniref:DHCW motif cupin fold protein n=1 Tax=Dyadobacter sp. NIV53 TaxID=2861765 RepID=UPI001C84796B|nr:DHCW motif cupin fold protein [Dyadobacter sp. NIV53]
MNNKNIPFQLINWDSVPKVEYPGDPGAAYWQTLQFEGLRIRMVELSPGYMADHWCRKGHIVHCLEGSFVSEMNDGSVFELLKGTSYVVSDEMSSHRSYTENGVKMMIIDGDFLKFIPD